MPAPRPTSVLAFALLAVAAGARAEEVSALLQHMTGTWEVRQRMWPGPDAAPVTLPVAAARRELVQGKFLEEVMEPVVAAAAPAPEFRRHALLNWNPVAHRYEYTSLDTRAPQLMTEFGATRGSPRLDGQALELQGGRFVASAWGDARDVPFTYRLTIGPVRDDEQIVLLYLTPLAVMKKREFLAFEYVYHRRAP